MKNSLILLGLSSLFNVHLALAATAQCKPQTLAEFTGTSVSGRISAEQEVPTTCKLTIQTSCETGKVELITQTNTFPATIRQTVDANLTTYTQPKEEQTEDGRSSLTYNKGILTTNSQFTEGFAITDINKESIEISPDLSQVKSVKLSSRTHKEGQMFSHLSYDIDCGYLTRTK